jgi:hypothetical protein
MYQGKLLLPSLEETSQHAVENKAFSATPLTASSFHAILLTLGGVLEASRLET